MEINDISNRIVAGARKALTEYKKWSGNYPVENYGSESIITSFIAQALMKDNKEHTLTIEEQFCNLYNNSNASTRGKKPEPISDSKRADIVLYNKDSTLGHIIEVKKKFQTQGILKDIERIALLLKKISNLGGGTLKSGHLAYIEHIYDFTSNTLDKEVNIEFDNHLSTIYDFTSKYKFISVNYTKDNKPIYYNKKDDNVEYDGDFIRYYYLTPVCINITLK